jgi:hypothetical protein
MTTAYESQNITLSDELIGIIRDSLYKEGNLHLLKRLEKLIKWDSITEIVTKYLSEASDGTFRNNKVSVLIKCLVLENIFNFSDYKLFVELAEKDDFQKFIGIDSPVKIPKVKIISSFRSNLMLNSIYEMLFDKFNEQLIEGKNEILDHNLRDEEKEQDIVIVETDEPDSIYEAKMHEIEERLKKLSEKEIPAILSGTDYETAYDLRDKLLKITKQIDRLASGKLDSSSENYQKMLNIENSIINISGLAEKLENNKNQEKEKSEVDLTGTEKLYNKMINSFFVSLDENDSKKAEETVTKGEEKENIIQEKLQYTNKIIQELKDSLKNLDEISVSGEIHEPEKLIETIPEKPVFEEIVTEVEAKIGPEIIVAPETIIVPETIVQRAAPVIEPELKEEPAREEKIILPSPVLIYPQEKTEGIFNDENLTEDYELGFRFHQLGLKMGFFNVILDMNNDASRISTAEFFPNTLWSAVKQRSRWIAGICFQNWKEHQWKGNLTAKYFMFRDRKPLFSIIGAFLSNILFLYMVYVLAANIFKFANPDFVVRYGSVLWYLMVANLFFMISRITHRFAFTYNWYGFMFASRSIFRLVIDTFVNFLAVLRSFKVYKQTKKKVVWDSTTHY